MECSAALHYQASMMSLPGSSMMSLAMINANQISPCYVQGCHQLLARLVKLKLQRVSETHLKISTSLKMFQQSVTFAKKDTLHSVIHLHCESCAQGL